MKLIPTLLFVLFAGCVPALRAATTNVVLTITSPWRYNTNNLNATPAWKTTAYNDSAWPGPSNALLYIETSTAIPASKNTPLPERSGGGPMNTYYFRTTFNLNNAAGVSSLLFSNLVDDGAVYYLNGVEVQRLYMAAGTVTYATLATSHEADTWSVFTLTGDALTNLVEGQNTLAAEVHQTSPTSSDIVFGSAVAAIYGLGTNLTRGPYLQRSSTDSIVIRWRTDPGTDSRVDYGTNLADLNLTTTLATLTGEHIVTLTNLSADTKYYYAVGTSDQRLAAADENQFFLTHPPVGTPKALRVWVIGDAGTKNANQVAVRDAFYNFNGTNTVHAWLQLGDNAYDTGADADYQAAVFDMYPTLLRKCVTWPTLGNHDTAQFTVTNAYPYFDMFTLPAAGEAGGVPSATEYYYSFDLGMVHFICLDSMVSDRSTNGAMAIWLRSDLAVNTNRWLVAFWHHPPYSKGSHDSDVDGPSYDTQMGEMRTNFVPILEAGGVDLVFCGHSHVYERSKLLNGHYGLSTSFNAAANIIQTGSGRETNGVGAYHKPDGLGEHPVGNRGTIYTVAGCSGQATSGTIDHPAMFYSELSLGSVVLDFNTNRLDAIFLRDTGATNDSYTIIKDGTYPPRLTELAPLANGDFQFTVLTRGYRTNIVEASPDIVPAGAWQPIGTNTTTNTFFSFIHTNALTNASQFYRVRRP